MHPKSERGPGRQSAKREGGFTLVEFLISALIMSIVLSSAVALASSVQNAFQSDLDAGVVEQEARYALDWIARDLRGAGSNPYAVAGNFVVLDPNGGAACNSAATPTGCDSIQIQADVNPPNGDLTDDDEDITIALDAANNVITRQDPNAANPAALAMTENIFTDLQFRFLDSSRTPTAVPGLVAFIQVQVTARSRGRNFYTNEFTESTLTTEVRLRTR